MGGRESGGVCFQTPGKESLAGSRLYRQGERKNLRLWGEGGEKTGLSGSRNKQYSVYIRCADFRQGRRLGTQEERFDAKGEGEKKDWENLFTRHESRHWRRIRGGTYIGKTTPDWARGDQCLKNVSEKLHKLKEGEGTHDES